MRKKYIFLWEERRFSWNKNLNRLERVESYPVPKAGSFSVARVDGRLSSENIHSIAVDFAKKEKAAGYSIGYISSHDPNNEACQAISKFKKV